MSLDEFDTFKKVFLQIVEKNAIGKNVKRDSAEMTLKVIDK